MNKKNAAHSRAIYRSIDEVPAESWDLLVASKNIYLTRAYLKALESAMQDQMDFFYTISFAKDGSPLVAAAFQSVQFVDKRRAYSKALCKLSYHIHKKLVDVFTINVLVCGNVFSDGENGFLWSDAIDAETAISEIETTIASLKEHDAMIYPPSITLFKDFWPESSGFSDRLKEYSYRDFMIDVNMVLTLHDSWKTLDDYLKSMKTKFRTRAKSVYAKSAAIEIRSFSAADIDQHSDRIEELFGNVLEKADFSYGKLTIKAFVNFKRALDDDFSFRAFFLNDEMIGFSTAFFNKGNLEANYVGLDYTHNVDYAVYQRILYDYVEQALVGKAKELQLGRTAELVKSAIGALPTNMRLYAKHRKTVSNLLLKPVLQSISPSEFELRKPFKSNFVS